MSTALQVRIQDVELQQIMYKDEPVVTYQQIADVHDIPLNNVRQSFYRNQERFVEGKHYFKVDSTEASSLSLTMTTNPNGITLFTQKGYLLLTKPMGDDRSWQVQEQMIDQYFTLRKIVQSKAPTELALVAEMSKHMAVFAGSLAAIERKYDYELEQNKRVERIQAIEWKERKKLKTELKELKKEVTQLRQQTPVQQEEPNGPMLIHLGLRILKAKTLAESRRSAFYRACEQEAYDQGEPVGVYKTKKGGIASTFTQPVIKAVAKEFGLLD